MMAFLEAGRVFTDLKKIHPPTGKGKPEANLFRDFLRLCWYYLIALRISFMDRVVLIVDSLYFEDYGTCSIGTAGDHGVFLFHPALHDGTAL